MPEGLEAEIYRRAGEHLVGGRIEGITVDPACGDARSLAVLVGAQIESVRRIGKLVLVDTAAGVLGMHFGMTGRLVVDGSAPIEALEYGSARDDPRWDRLVLVVDGRVARVNDPRRWSRHTLDPDVSRLGVDIFAGAKNLRLRLDSVSHRTAAIKAVLLDQAVIAGIGNLIADEVLFTAGIDPARPFSSLDQSARAELARVISRVVRRLDRLGGSHMGVMGPAMRSVGGLCPKDGATFARGEVGGRTTLWCPVHQR
ncbi:MAG: formamidopyrimidine-DNA glycosylase [Actinomycetota bacterium]|nr:formamidopyrimidine-DNA glycosylase [Actinomycetota bacterium]